MSRPPLFYGWWLVLMALACMVVGGPVVTFTFGTFVGPLHDAYGWSRAQLSLGPSLALIGATLSQPILGRCVDRFGSRWAIFVCAFGFGASWIGLFFVSDALWQFYVLYFSLGAFGAGVGPVTLAPVLSHWFEKKRGLAFGLAMIGIGLGGFLMVPLAQWLIDIYGWRAAYAVIGGLVWVVVFSVVGLLLRERPEPYGLLPDGASASPQASTGSNTSPSALSLSLQQAWRTRSFWCLFTAFFLSSVVIHGVLIHLIPLLTDQGLSRQRAASYLAVLALSSTVARAGAGFLADWAHVRWAMGAKYVAFGSFMAASLGISWLWQGTDALSITIFVILFGLSLGAEMDLFPYMTSRCFGLGAFGELYAYVLVAFGLGGMVGPYLTGTLYELNGSYASALQMFLGLMSVSAVLMLPLRALEQPAGK